MLGEQERSDPSSLIPRARYHIPCRGGLCLSFSVRDAGGFVLPGLCLSPAVQDPGGFVLPASPQPCGRCGGGRFWGAAAGAPGAGLWEEGGSCGAGKGSAADARSLSKPQHPSTASFPRSARMQPPQGSAAGFGRRGDEPGGRVRPVPLPPVQQNLNYCPHIFWVDGCAETGAPCPPAVPSAPFPPPVPDRSTKPRNKGGERGERSSTGFLVMFLLILVAFTGVGLSIFKIFHLEKEVDELREVRFAWLGAGPWGKGERSPRNGLRCSRGHQGGISVAAGTEEQGACSPIRISLFLSAASSLPVYFSTIRSSPWS